MQSGLTQSKYILISIAVNYFKDFPKREKRDALVAISLIEIEMCHKRACGI
jgi:hypothetical protein